MLMSDYLDKLAGSLNSYPVDLSGVAGKNLVNPSNFNRLQQMRLLNAIRDRYLRRGVSSRIPIENFGQGTATALADPELNQ